MENYRKKMVKEISKGECSCCGNSFQKVLIHHIDGNRENNKKINLIPVCEVCHALIHKGFHKKRFLDNIIKENILCLRKIILIKLHKYSPEYSEDRIKYERAISSNYGCVKYCIFCKSQKNLRLYAPDFIIKFDPTNRRNFGIIICKECSGNKDNISDLNLVSTLSTTSIK